MSKGARIYYQERADLLDRPMPRLLDGVPFPLVPSNYPNPIGPYVVGRFSQLLLPIQPFLVAGIPEVFAAQDRHLSLKQWEHIQKLPYNRVAYTVDQHAKRVIVPHLAAAIPSGAIYTEALARSDLSEVVWNRLVFKTGSNPPKTHDELASAFFLTREVDATQACTAAVVTVAWATYFDGLHMTMGERPKKESLTVRYLSAPLLDAEIAILPPLT